MKLRHALTLAALILPLQALAAGPDHLRYDYLDLGITFGDLDGTDADFTGLAVGGSWGFHENIAMIAGIGVGEIDGGIADVDTTELSVGINPHFSIANNVDLVIPVGLVFADVDGGILSDDDTGYSIGIGIRALPNPAWEFAAGIQHVDIFDGDDQSFVGSVRWHTNELFSVSVGLNASDDASAWTIGGRFSF